MTDNSVLPPAGGPAMPAAATPRQGQERGRALLAAALVLAGSVLVGLIGGLIWAAAAPRVVYQMYTLKPPTAYAVNPETSAFIAADGWFVGIALVGGAAIGLLAYLFAVRRYGALPMAALVLGSLAAAYVAMWLGHEESGAPGFDHLLATSKPGALLHAPISLGAQGALAFWPIAAAAVAGGCELANVLRERHQIAYGDVGPAPLAAWPPPAAPEPRPLPEPSEPAPPPDSRSPDSRREVG